MRNSPIPAENVGQESSTTTGKKKKKKKKKKKLSVRGPEFEQLRPIGSSQAKWDQHIGTLMGTIRAQLNHSMKQTYEDKQGVISPLCSIHGTQYIRQHTSETHDRRDGDAAGMRKNNT
jgi:hypothetical protein